MIIPNNYIENYDWEQSWVVVLIFAIIAIISSIFLDFARHHSSMTAKPAPVERAEPAAKSLWNPPAAK